MAYTPELLAEKKRIEQHVKIGSEALYLTKAECMENGPTVEDTRHLSHTAKKNTKCPPR